MLSLEDVQPEEGRAGPCWSEVGREAAEAPGGPWVSQQGPGFEGGLRECPLHAVGIMPRPRPVQGFGNSRQLNGASLGGAGLEWGQEGVGSEDGQDQGDMIDVKSETPARSCPVNTKYPWSGPSRDTHLASIGLRVTIVL